MSGFVEGIDRSQSSLFPAELEDYVAEDNLLLMRGLSGSRSSTFTALAAAGTG
jgi:hypothetical protein